MRQRLSHIQWLKLCQHRCSFRHSIHKFFIPEAQDNDTSSLVHHLGSTLLVTWWPITHLHPLKLVHTFIVSKLLPSWLSIAQNRYFRLTSQYPSLNSWYLIINLILAPCWATIVVNSFKMTPIKCWTSDFKHISREWIVIYNKLFK